MTLRKEIESIRPGSGSKGLALMAVRLGYNSPFKQLSFSNGATASDLFEFFDDNPGACQAVIEWVLQCGGDADGQELEEDMCPDCEEENCYDSDCLNDEEVTE